MTARELMTPNPACCTMDTPLREVARLMVHCDCGEIPVVERLDLRKPVGVVTDRDIVCRVVAEGKDPSTLTAAAAIGATSARGPTRAGTRRASRRGSGCENFPGHRGWGSRGGEPPRNISG